MVFLIKIFNSEGYFLNTYKYGWKTSYYQNTYDNKKDGEEEPVVTSDTNSILSEIESMGEESECDACNV